MDDSPRDVIFCRYGFSFYMRFGPLKAYRIATYSILVIRYSKSLKCKHFHTNIKSRQFEKTIDLYS